MRHITIALVAACAPQQTPAGPAADTGRNSRRSDWWIQGETPERHRVPPLERTESVRPESPIAGIEIGALPSGGAGWEFVIANDTIGVITVIWDESTFVSSNGESWGRLIRGETRRMDVANPQPPTPIAAASRHRQFVLVEKALFVEEEEAKVSRLGSISREALDNVVAVRQQRKALIVGGALNVTIQLADGKRTWVGRVRD